MKLPKLSELPRPSGKVAILAAVVLFALAAGAAWKLAVGFDQRLAYQAPIAAESTPVTPRATALEERAAAEAEAARTRPYEEAEYRQFPVVGSRVAIWVVAQLHLLFAAFVLAVPMFAVIIEYIGYKTGDKRYDKLAYEFTKLLSVSFSLTAAFGAGLTFMLIALYPKFTNYLMHVFSPTFLPYVLLFFFEAGFLYSYYYGWGKFGPRLHLLLGVMLNVVGTGIMFIANAWLTFMMSPRGIAETGALISTWEAVTNYTWMPINIHRLIANVAFGGSVAAAYAAYRFLKARTAEERAHYDWMGYIGNFVAIAGFLPLPFAGYWLASEIYAFSQTMGLTMMGGAFSWLFIIQAVLIGVLFLFANWYLWLGMGRVPGSEKFRPATKWLLIVIVLCFAVWATPSSPISSARELQAMGGARHPNLGYLGVMAAKNTAVNLMILATYVSFLLYRRCGRDPVVSWRRAGNWAQIGIVGLATVSVIFFGVLGYFVEAAVRIKLSIPQVLSVLAAMVLVTILDVFLLRGAKRPDTRWGQISHGSQYALIVLAVTFTWLMGLMGYVRSGLRQHWHVFGVVRDTSVDAFTPTLGYATKVVSVTVLIFFGLIAVVFWLSSLAGKKEHSIAAEPSSPRLPVGFQPAPAGAGASSSSLASASQAQFGKEGRAPHPHNPSSPAMGKEGRVEASLPGASDPAPNAPLLESNQGPRGGSRVAGPPPPAAEKPATSPGRDASTRPGATPGTSASTRPGGTPNSGGPR